MQRRGEHYRREGRVWRSEWRLSTKMATDILRTVPLALKKELGTVAHDFCDGAISKAASDLTVAIHAARDVAETSCPPCPLSSSRDGDNVLLCPINRLKYARKDVPTEVATLLERCGELTARLAALRKGATCKDGRARFDPEARCDIDAVGSCCKAIEENALACRSLGYPEVPPTASRDKICVLAGGCVTGKFWDHPPGIDVLVALLRVLRLGSAFRDCAGRRHTYLKRIRRELKQDPQLKRCLKDSFGLQVDQAHQHLDDLERTVREQRRLIWNLLLSKERNTRAHGAFVDTKEGRRETSAYASKRTGVLTRDHSSFGSFSSSSSTEGNANSGQRKRLRLRKATLESPMGKKLASEDVSRTGRRLEKKRISRLRKKKRLRRRGKENDNGDEEVESDRLSWIGGTPKRVNEAPGNGEKEKIGDRDAAHVEGLNSERRRNERTENAMKGRVTGLSYQQKGKFSNQREYGVQGQEKEKETTTENTMASENMAREISVQKTLESEINVKFLDNKEDGGVTDLNRKGNADKGQGDSDDDSEDERGHVSMIGLNYLDSPWLRMIDETKVHNRFITLNLFYRAPRTHVYLSTNKPHH